MIKRYKEIQQIAQEQFEKAEGKVPVPVVQIAHNVGLEIYDTDMRKVGNSFPSGILTTMEGKWVIILNNQDSWTRKRFTIAHEIGHFLLHRGKKFIDHFSAGETFYRGNEQDEKLEREANFFAANLLMPGTELKKIWPSCDDPVAAAEIFDVSEVSMTFRLKNLKLIKDDV